MRRIEANRLGPLPWLEPVELGFGGFGFGQHSIPQQTSASLRHPQVMSLGFEPSLNWSWTVLLCSKKGRKRTFPMVWLIGGVELAVVVSVPFPGAGAAVVAASLLIWKTDSLWTKKFFFVWIRENWIGEIVSGPEFVSSPKFQVYFGRPITASDLSWI